MTERSFIKRRYSKFTSFHHRLRRLLLKPKEERFAVTQSFSPPTAQLLDGYPMGIVTQSPLALGQCSKKFRGCDSPDPKRRSKAAWLEPLSSWLRQRQLSCIRNTAAADLHSLSGSLKSYFRQKMLINHIYNKINSHLLLRWLFMHKEKARKNSELLCIICHICDGRLWGLCHHGRCCSIFW